MKKYFINYSILGGGCIEVIAKDRAEAEDLFYDLDVEELMGQTEFDDGPRLEWIEDEEGNCVEEDKCEDDGADKFN